MGAGDHRRALRRQGAGGAGHGARPASACVRRSPSRWRCSRWQPGVLLAADTFGWPWQLPGVERMLLAALLVATTVMQIAGPVLTQFGCATSRASEHCQRGRLTALTFP